MNVRLVLFSGIALTALAVAAVPLALQQLRLLQPKFAVLDVTELYRLKEAQITANLVQRDADPATRERLLVAAAQFHQDLQALLRELPKECHCIVLNRAALLGSETEMNDMTLHARQRLGL